MQARWPVAQIQIDSPTKFSSKYWRDRAAATMVQADRDCIDEKQKFRLLRIALEYDKLANAAALRETALAEHAKSGDGRFQIEQLTAADQSPDAGAGRRSRRRRLDR